MGFWLAIAIISLWFTSLGGLLALNCSTIPGVGIVVAVLGRTFLHTGLFIVAHDAMHLSLMPRQPRMNHFIGGLAVRLYALLPYHHCRVNHWKHHRYPAQKGDPDFHGGNAHPICWYFKFLREYLPGYAIVAFLGTGGTLFAVLSAIAQVSSLNLLLFWILPLLLSSLQLFFFGTYLPHRSPKGDEAAQGTIRSSHYPVWGSFLACYHFGYHQEHHAAPHIPWYRLPSAHPARKYLSAQELL